MLLGSVSKGAMRSSPGSLGFSSCPRGTPAGNHRRRIASGALVELPGGNVVRNEPDLFEVFGQRVRASFGEVPFDARLLGFNENAERDLLGLRLGKRVGGQLVRERRLLFFVVGARRLEVDHLQAV